MNIFFNLPWESSATIKALNKSQAIIEFSTDGYILNANENFLNLMGYRLDEIKGKHHKIFVDESESKKDSYLEFWEDLKKGNYKLAEFKRIGKNKKVIWIEASYNPIFSPFGSPYKIIKFATDTTDKKNINLELKSQIEAINKSYAVISFSMDGTILSANENFLSTFGYSLNEISGRHHSMFVDEAYSKSIDYKKFWESLKGGSFQSAEYKRYGKNKKEIWIQSSYNPIFNLNGVPYKVVKYATDITEDVKERLRRVEVQKEIDLELNKIYSSLKNTTEKVNSANNAAQNTSTKVQEIAAGAEELDASINEIKNQTRTAHDITQSTIEKAKETNDVVQVLSGASAKIGDVINLINEIATQTNLLSLNAAIEAARAGESGRGFAIVASEVKKLSDETANATKEISNQIKNVQSYTVKAVLAIEEIFKTISTIGHINEIISKALDEQSLVTKDMANNMTAAAENVETINTSITDISESANQIRDFTERLKTTSESIV